MASLGLTPLDLLRLSVDASGRDELAWRAHAAAEPDAQRRQGIRATLAAPPAGARTGVTVWDLLEVASSAYTLMSKARPLDGADLQPPQVSPAPGLDLDEYDGRAAAAHAALLRAREKLAGALASEAPPQLAEAATAIASFGSAQLDAAPAPLGQAMLAELDRRLAEAQTTAAPAPGESGAARRARIVRRFAAVFGPGLVPAPRFACPSPDELSASAEDAGALTGGDPLAGQTWSLRMARLRPAVAQLDLVLREAEALGNDPGPALRVAQLPHVAGQRWVGLPPDGDLREGVISLVLHGNGLGRLGGALTGLLIDEWTEVVPHRSETTGIVFRYDPPDAAPPQAILLAVPPVEDEPWTVGTLNQVLLETLDLAHLRACGPAELESAGHYLPAAVLAFNLDGDAVSTDLNPLTPQS